MSRRAHYQTAYRQRLRKTIEAWSEPVFSRQDLTQDTSNRGQLRLNRALKTFVEEGFIIKISHGLYAKAMKMSMPDARTAIVLQESFEIVAIAALNKLGVEWEFGDAIQAYNRGDTTQIPVVFSVKLRSRFRGTIRAEGREVLFEDTTNAR